MALFLIKIFSYCFQELAIINLNTLVKTIISKLPFQLTNAQKKVIKHIIENIHDPKPMMRLLQ